MTTLDDVPQADLALVANAREGRRDAFAELYRRHYAPAFRYALSLTRGAEALAQDVVAEAFAGVLRATFEGRGSTVAFRPYLLSAVRHEFLAEQRRFGRVALVDDDDELDSPARDDEALDDFTDPVVVSAFSRLPARWRAVLWHMEVQGDKPADLARFMGISANAVAALASRAREGLRQEYLQEQVERRGPECQPYASRLGRLVRGGLSRRERRRLEGHLDRCADCARAHADLASLNQRLRSGLPVLGGAGPLLAGYGLESGTVASGAAGSGAVPAGVAASGAVPAGVATSGATVSGCVGSVGAAGSGALAGAAVAAPVGAGVVGMAPVGMAAGLAIASAAAVLGLSGIKAPNDAAASAAAPDAVASVSNELAEDDVTASAGDPDGAVPPGEDAELEVVEEGLAAPTGEPEAAELVSAEMGTAALPSVPSTAVADKSSGSSLPTGQSPLPMGRPDHATPSSGSGSSTKAEPPSGGTEIWPEWAETPVPPGRPSWSNAGTQSPAGSESNQPSATPWSPADGTSPTGAGATSSAGRHAKAGPTGNGESSAGPGANGNGGSSAGQNGNAGQKGNPGPPATPPGRHARR